MAARPPASRHASPSRSGSRGAWPRRRGGAGPRPASLEGRGLPAWKPKAPPGALPHGGACQRGAPLRVPRPVRAWPATGLPSDSCCFLMCCFPSAVWCSFRSHAMPVHSTSVQAHAQQVQRATCNTSQASKGTAGERVLERNQMSALGAACRLAGSQPARRRFTNRLRCLAPPACRRRRCPAPSARAAAGATPLPPLPPPHRRWSGASGCGPAPPAPPQQHPEGLLPRLPAATAASHPRSQPRLAPPGWAAGGKAALRLLRLWAAGGGEGQVRQLRRHCTHCTHCTYCTYCTHCTPAGSGLSWSPAQQAEQSRAAATHIRPAPASSHSKSRKCSNQGSPRATSRGSHQRPPLPACLPGALPVSSCSQRKSSDRPGVVPGQVQAASSAGVSPSSMPCQGTGALQRRKGRGSRASACGFADAKSEASRAAYPGGGGGESRPMKAGQGRAGQPAWRRGDPGLQHLG